MKHLNTREQSAPQFKENKRCLTAIESLIKSESYRELGFKKLKELDADILCNKHYIWDLYLNGRCHIYQYKTTQDIEDLETANDFFDDMATSAFERSVKKLELRFLFTRANTKYKLANLVWEEERKTWLLKKAEHICDVVLKHNPNNDSFSYLKTQFASYIYIIKLLPLIGSSFSF
ncbi:hypothetical protein [Lacinutrix chionoecetis]